METQSYSGPNTISSAESSTSQSRGGGIWEGSLRGVIAAWAAGFLLGWIVPNSDVEDRTLPSLLDKMMGTNSASQPEGGDMDTIHDSTGSTSMSSSAAEE